MKSKPLFPFQERVSTFVRDKIEWKEIPSAPEYYASKTGQIWSGKSWKHLKPGLACGYRQVCLKIAGKRINRKVAWLVLETFVGPRPTNFECCHFDGNRQHDWLSNLRWDTKRANRLDTLRYKETHSWKLTEKQVRSIRYLLTQKQLTQREIGLQFNVCHSVISNIKTGRSWSHVKGGDTI